MGIIESIPSIHYIFVVEALYMLHITFIFSDVAIAIAKFQRD